MALGVAVGGEQLQNLAPKSATTFISQVIMRDVRASQEQVRHIITVQPSPVIKSAKKILNEPALTTISLLALAILISTLCFICLVVFKAIVHL